MFVENGVLTQKSVIGDVFESLRFALWGTGITSVFVNVLMLTGPIFMLQVYDRVLMSGSVPTLVVIGAFAVTLYVFYGLFDGLRSRLLNRIGQRVDAQLSGASYAVSTTSPMLLGAKANHLRPVRDIDSLRQFLSGAGPAAILDIPWLPFYLGIVFLFHPMLGFVALAGTVIICVLIGLNEYYSRKPTEEFSQESTRRSNLVEIGRRNAEAIKAMGMLGDLQHRWDQANQEYLVKQGVSSDRTHVFSTAIKTFRFFLQSLILGVGAWLAIHQEITPGVMIAASILSSRAFAPVEQAVGQWRGFIAARQSLSRLKQVIDTQPDQTKSVDLPLPSEKLSVENIACGAPGSQMPFVQNVAFELNAGEGLGIIGPSGSGKSTLVRSLVGVTPALKGAVRFDGAELSQWSDEKIGQFMGYLPQDIQLFDGSVAENISRFALEADSDAVIQAAKLAGVHGLIVGLPEGYDTVLGAGGLALSGGQKQRIALARALYGEPFLLVLDEPNSNLDAEGEQALSQVIHSMRERGSIVIVIAHRPSAITAVDKVLCMKAGQMVAFGPKEEVMNKVVAAIPRRGTA